jgi:hypothetical protein
MVDFPSLLSRLDKAFADLALANSAVARARVDVRLYLIEVARESKRMDEENSRLRDRIQELECQCPNNSAKAFSRRIMLDDLVGDAVNECAKAGCNKKRELPTDWCLEHQSCGLNTTCDNLSAVEDVDEAEFPKG